jgi:uncharacterized membrane protein YdbT with pleckstrin-like domain
MNNYYSIINAVIKKNVRDVHWNRNASSSSLILLLVVFVMLLLFFYLVQTELTFFRRQLQTEK